MATEDVVVAAATEGIGVVVAATKSVVVAATEGVVVVAASSTEGVVIAVATESLVVAAAASTEGVVIIAAAATEGVVVTAIEWATCLYPFPNATKFLPVFGFYRTLKIYQLNVLEFKVNHF